MGVDIASLTHSLENEEHDTPRTKSHQSLPHVVSLLHTFQCNEALTTRGANPAGIRLYIRKHERLDALHVLTFSGYCKYHTFHCSNFLQSVNNPSTSSHTYYTSNRRDPKYKRYFQFVQTDALTEARTHAPQELYIYKKRNPCRHSWYRRFTEWRRDDRRRRNKDSSRETRVPEV